MYYARYMCPFVLDDNISVPIRIKTNMFIHVQYRHPCRPIRQCTRVSAMLDWEGTAILFNGHAHQVGGHKHTDTYTVITHQQKIKYH